MTLMERMKNAALIVAFKDMELYRDMQGAFFFAVKGGAADTLLDTTHEEAAAWSKEHLEPEEHAKIFPEE